MWLAALWLTIRAIGSIVMVPIAEELAFRGLPKKAFACMSIGNADMTFGDARTLA